MRWPRRWSVAVETTFYALFPLLALWINSLQRAVVLTAATTLGAFFLLPRPCLRGESASVRICGISMVSGPAAGLCMGFVAYFTWKDLVPADPSDFFPLHLPDSRRGRVTLVRC